MFFKLPRKTIDELLYRVLRSIYENERDIISAFNLNYQEIILLQYLRRQSPTRVSDIAEELTVPMFTATRLLQRLEARGLVKRSQSAQDRRTVMISLEKAGEETIMAIENRSYEVMAKNLHELPETEVSSYVTLASKLDNILGVSENFRTSMPEVDIHEEK